MIERYWMGSEPKECDICKNPLMGKFVDGRTMIGCWGMMCLKCHERFGVGLGTGKGQQYELQDDSRWLKTRG